MESTAETQDQPMELTSLRYTPSLIGSADSPPSPIMATDNALLDAPKPEVLGLDQSKAPGAGRLKGSPKSKMTLRK